MKTFSLLKKVFNGEVFRVLFENNWVVLFAFSPFSDFRDGEILIYRDKDFWKSEKIEPFCKLVFNDINAPRYGSDILQKLFYNPLGIFLKRENRLLLLEEGKKLNIKKDKFREVVVPNFVCYYTNGNITKRTNNDLYSQPFSDFLENNGRNQKLIVENFPPNWKLIRPLSFQQNRMIVSDNASLSCNGYCSNCKQERNLFNVFGGKIEKTPLMKINCIHTHVLRSSGKGLLFSCPCCRHGSHSNIWLKENHKDDALKIWSDNNIEDCGNRRDFFEKNGDWFVYAIEKKSIKDKRWMNSVRIMNLSTEECIEIPFQEVEQKFSILCGSVDNGCFVSTPMEGIRDFWRNSHSVRVNPMLVKIA